MATDILPVNCPTCHKATRYTTENKFRPFCSERCRLIDLGAWVDEKNRVPGDEVNLDQPLDDHDIH